MRMHGRAVGALVVARHGRFSTARHTHSCIFVFMPCGFGIGGGGFTTLFACCSVVALRSLAATHAQTLRTPNTNAVITLSPRRTFGRVYVMNSCWKHPLTTSACAEFGFQHYKLPLREKVIAPQFQSVLATARSIFGLLLESSSTSTTLRLGFTSFTTTRFLFRRTGVFLHSGLTLTSAWCGINI